MSSGRTRGAGSRRMEDPWATSSTAASRPAYGTSDVDLYQTADRNYLRTIDDLRAKVKSLRTTAKKLSSLRSSFQSGTATARQRELLCVGACCALHPSYSPQANLSPPGQE